MSNGLEHVTWMDEGAPEFSSRSPKSTFTHIVLLVLLRDGKEIQQSYSDPLYLYLSSHRHVVTGHRFRMSSSVPDI